ncbi:hypothetical protein [Erythrobacter sp. SAORIC-644]|uniref:hypothetical protein n=1 Tax=Erythrobacter sp. SAORIC-644 TaxID=1869314 RepID=UPI001F341D73|nr:hypothetical protein [Erythrobacter sp. SAORIC-644]
MGSDNAGLDQLKSAPWDRLAGWDRWPARILLLVVAALLVLAAIAPLSATLDGKPSEVPSLIGDGAPNGQTESERDEDLAFYDRVIERIGQGENYYDFIVEEQRARDYPVRPGLAVRLPTLAWIHASLGEPAMIALAVALLFACIWAWWKRLGEEPGGARFRLLGTALMAMGGSLGLNRSFFVLHELWAGMLIALAFGLHRPGRWGAALFVAALALALRELVLPFVLLMAAMAAWRKDWREATAWIMLVAVFAAIMAWHLSLIAVQEVPSDPVGPDWLVLRGLSGWLGNIVLSSNLRLLPHELASPVVILMALGWAGWKSSAGTTGTFLYLGYGLAFMLAGRANNFYWGAVVAPAMFIGLAFLPMALPSLVRAARGKA